MLCYYCAMLFLCPNPCGAFLGYFLFFFDHPRSERCCCPPCGFCCSATFSERSRSVCLPCKSRVFCVLSVLFELIVSSVCFLLFFVIFARLLPSVVLMLSAAIECTIVKILSLCRKPPDSGLSADIEPTLALLQNVLLLRFFVFFLCRKVYPA